MKELGMRSQVWGNIKLKDKIYLKNSKILRFMNDGSIYAFLSMEEAIKSSNLKAKQYQKIHVLDLLLALVEEHQNIILVL